MLINFTFFVNKLYISSTNLSIILMIHSRLLPIFSVLLLFFGCGNHAMNQLCDIESYIQNHPDSALNELQTIDTSRVFSRREKAYYSLLMAMALDKNLIDTTDMSVISPAVDWFSRHKEGEHRAASYFYAGRISYNAGDYSNAILNFQKAKEESSSLYWKGMTSNHMAYTYNKCYNDKEELSCGLEALKYWLEFGDSLKIRQTYSSLAVAYHNNRMDAEADSLLSILCDAEVPYYPAFIQKAEYRIKGSAPDYDEIVGLFETGIHNGAPMILDEWYEYAYALYKVGNRTRSQNILDQLSSTEESIASCLWLGRIAKDEGNLEKALQYLEKRKKLADKVVCDQLSHSLFKAQSDHYRIQSEIEKREAGHARFIALFVFVVAVFMLLLLHYRFKSKKIELDTEIARINGIAEKTAEMLSLAQKDAEETEIRNNHLEHQMEDLRRIYAKLHQSQFSEIGRLAEIGLNSTNLSPNAANSILHKTTEILDEISSGEKGQKDFEKRINKDFENIMDKIRSDFPDLKESDYRLLSFIVVGFDATTRAILMNDTVNNMRVKKSRLLKKILDSKTDNDLLYSSILKSK